MKHPSLFTIRQTVKRLSFVVLLSALLVGCQPRPPHAGPYLLKKNPLGGIPMQHRERLIAMDQSAADSLFYVSHRQNRLPSGQVLVQINLQNRDAANNIWMDWKVVFYDEQTFKIEETEWYHTYFPAKEVRTLRVNSIRPDVQNFTVILRSPSTEKGIPYKVQKEYVR